MDQNNTRFSSNHSRKPSTARLTVAFTAIVVLLASATLPSQTAGSASAQGAEPAQNNDVSRNFYTAIRANNLGQLRALVSSGADVNVKGPGQVTPLMDAALSGSLDAMQVLIDKGADVNAKDAGGRTPLIRSATELAKIRLLVEHGANVNAATQAGRSVLIVAAMSENSAEIVRYLLSKGADPKAVDSLGINTVLAAAIGNDTATIQLLVNAGANVNVMGKGDLPGTLSPLMMAAANSNLTAMRLLLDKGADVNAVSALESDGRVKNGPIANGRITALIAAAPFGRADVIKMLLDAGAKVNVKDARGMTPLMLATATDHHESTQVLKMLLDHGAEVNARDTADQTVLDWAKKTAWPEAVKMFSGAGATPGNAAPISAPAPAPVALQPALERSIALMENTSKTFFAKGGCISCHAQNVTDLLIADARAKRIRIDPATATESEQNIRGMFGLFGPDMLERLEPPIPEIAAFSLVALGVANATPDRTTDAVVSNLAAHQSTDGAWHFAVLKRPPMMEGSFSRTALVARALKMYSLPGRSKEWADRLAKARQWLMTTKPFTTEDRNMQLLGLTWLGSEPSVTRGLAKDLIAAQQPDGGWKQQAGLASDAYATGQTLYALATSHAMATSDPAFKKGIEFLLKTQRADGSWHVASRAPKFQPYFESGFPYGHDQWISMMATGWAAMALTAAIDRPAVAGAR